VCFKWFFKFFCDFSFDHFQFMRMECLRSNFFQLKTFKVIDYTAPIPAPKVKIKTKAKHLKYL